MSSNSILPFPSSTHEVAITPPPQDASGNQPRQQTLATLVHRLLRGRYPLVIALVLLGGAGGAVGGYLSKVPKYRTDAFVQIQPALPKILYQTEQASISPMFSNFVNTQVKLLQNDRVIARAMNSEAWRGLGRGRQPEEEAEFRQSLSVTALPNALLISVSFTDEQSRASFVAVQEVIGAYQEIFGGSEDKNIKEMQNNTLNSLRDKCEGERRDLRTRVAAASSEFETDDLTRLHDHYLTQLLALDSRIVDAQLHFTELGIDPDKVVLPPPGDSSNSALSSTLTPKQIAATDESMARLLVDQSALKRRIARNRALGYGDGHPTVINDTSDLAAIDAAIKELADGYDGTPSAAALPSGPPRLEQLVENYRRLKQQADALRIRTELISRRRIEIDGLNREIKSKDEKLAEINHRLEEISVESRMKDQVGRIEPILPDGAPGTPTVDSRRKMAALGLVLGGGTPIAIMLLIGLIDRRFRYADQARDATQAVPLLGILPELPREGGDPVQNAAAVHCVHHIRSLLQMTERTRNVLAVTSPAAGDGKTSLALSLALSFTASGSRTLVIDFDLIGCGLTSRLDAMRTEGLGHALVQGAGHGHVVPTGVPGLDLLPAGREDARCISRISRGAFVALIDEYRSRYDSIIVDTGPALGSLEANLAASVADGVILVVGRGQRADRVQEVLRHLHQLGATTLGMVFNRAHATDFARSTMSQSIRSLQSEDSQLLPAVASTQAEPIAMKDPLARSVMSDLRR